jgi:hypothetical protein
MGEKRMDDGEILLTAGFSAPGWSYGPRFAGMGEKSEKDRGVRKRYHRDVKFRLVVC